MSKWKPNEGKIKGGYVIVYDYYLDLKREYNLDNGDILCLAKIVTLDVGLGICTISDRRLGYYLNETVRNIQKRLSRLEEKKLIQRRTMTDNNDGRAVTMRVIDVNYDLVENESQDNV